MLVQARRSQATRALRSSGSETFPSQWLQKCRVGPDHPKACAEIRLQLLTKGKNITEEALLTDLNQIDRGRALSAYAGSKKLAPKLKMPHSAQYLLDHSVTLKECGFQKRTARAIWLAINQYAGPLFINNPDDAKTAIQDFPAPLPQKVFIASSQGR